MTDRIASTATPIHELLAQRESPRAFQSKSVSRRTLLGLLEAARWSPSCFNEQPWRFLVATKDEPEGFERVASLLASPNQRWARSAPVLMIAFAVERFSRNDKENIHAWYDVGQAVAHLTFEATARGLSVHQMAGFDREAAREALRVPDGVTPATAIALGYKGDAGDLPDDLAEKERAPRTRKPIEDWVYAVKFGYPWEGGR